MLPRRTPLKRGKQLKRTVGLRSGELRHRPAAALRSEAQRRARRTVPKVRQTDAPPSKPVVRKRVAARDGDYCLICGRPPRGLHLHRIRYGSEGGAYEEGNCVQLCGAHHDLVHSDKRVWKPLLQAYVVDATEHAAGPARQRFVAASPFGQVALRR